jgi:CheY-like chemotaxis protein
MFAVGLSAVQPAHSSPPPALDKSGLSGRRVLALDNDPASLDALRQVLAGWGSKVSVARDGADAAVAMEEGDADLWLFDYHLDDGDTGVAVAQRLGRRFGARPCLILSADQTEAVRRAVQEAGLPLLAKPVRPLALKSVLDRLLAARAM